MITSAILYLLYGFVWAITSPFRLLPDVALSSNITSAIASANTTLAPLAVVLPLGSLAGVLIIFLSVEGAIAIFKIIKWVYTKIPGIN
jgi:hypothetical protein